jgi:hypothetical protein
MKPIQTQESRESQMSLNYSDFFKDFYGKESFGRGWRDQAKKNLSGIN